MQIIEIWFISDSENALNGLLYTYSEAIQQSSLSDTPFGINRLFRDNTRYRNLDFWHFFSAQDDLLWLP